MKIWSRRKFLEAGVLGSIAVGSGAASSISSAQDGNAGQTKGAATAAPQGNEKSLLKAVMDELIPPGNGMPAASEAGGMDYLEKLSIRDAKVGKEIQQGLIAIENLSRKRFQTSFVLLSQERRAAVLTAIEKQDAEHFKTLRDSVYEAYYEDPQVWKSIDYTCYETNGGGPALEPFHDEILVEVRKKPKGYREA
jgi:hypothetical protein